MNRIWDQGAVLVTGRGMDHHIDIDIMTNGILKVDLNPSIKSVDNLDGKIFDLTHTKVGSWNGTVCEGFFNELMDTSLQDVLECGILHDFFGVSGSEASGKGRNGRNTGHKNSEE